MKESSIAILQVLQQAQGGDAGAMQDLLCRLRPYVHKLAQRKQAQLPVGQQPSDLTQDTLERVFLRLHQFGGTTEAELQRWLAVIVERSLIRQLRRSSRKRRAAELVPLPESDQLQPAEPRPSASQSLRGKEEWRQLLRAIHALPQAQRDVVRRHLRGEAVGEIARTLRRSPAAVSCLLQRAGRTLQQQLGGGGPLGPWFQSLREVLAASDELV